MYKNTETGKKFATTNDLVEYLADELVDNEEIIKRYDEMLDQTTLCNISINPISLNSILEQGEFYCDTEYRLLAMLYRAGYKGAGVMKRIDPIAYRCGLMDYIDDYISDLIECSDKDRLAQLEEIGYYFER